MAADSSISQSLGRLRIANPDEDSANTASPPPLLVNSNDNGIRGLNQAQTLPQPITSPESTGAVQRSLLQWEQHSEHGKRIESSGSVPLSNSDDSSDSHVTSPLSQDSSRMRPLGHHQSMPLNHRSQQEVMNPAHPGSVFPQVRNYTPPLQGTPPPRPISNLYGNACKYSSSDVSISASNRTREDRSPQVSESSISRRSSRSTVATQQGAPLRMNSESGSPLIQTQNMQIGNDQLSSRRSSRAPFNDEMERRPSNPNGQIPTSASNLEDMPTPSSEDWKEKGAAIGVRQEVNVDGKPVVKYVKKGVKDFTFGRTLGEGSYSTVVAATDCQTHREYAVKILDKRHIIKEKKVKYVNIEKDTLNRLTDHPGVVRLYYTFQDERSLYFVLDLATGGELLGVLKKITTFDMKCARFYGAQILDSVDYMHSRGVIHRDLKPENILLNDRMHVKITDFGTAKIMSDNANRDRSGSTTGDPLNGAEPGRTVSFVGTAEYVSPELLMHQDACKASDLWAFGCIIYQLLAGRPPFKARNEFLTFQKILALEYTFPDSFPEVAKDLVERLLVLDTAKRLPVEHVKNHAFFEGTQWGKELWKQKAPRLQPFVPPAQEPIKLNGKPSSYHGKSTQPNTPNHHHHNNSNQLRPTPRLITELPPPSQLDIDWSPVLTRNNERILKLGNLIVTSAPVTHSFNMKGTGSEPATETSRRLSRFFSGNTTKKRQRLVMVTSSARLILAAAGGEEKKAKMEVSLIRPSVVWSNLKDSRGITSWYIETVSASTSAKIST